MSGAVFVHNNTFKMYTYAYYMLNIEHTEVHIYSTVITVLMHHACSKV